MFFPSRVGKGPTPFYLYRLYVSEVECVYVSTRRGWKGIQCPYCRPPFYEFPSLVTNDESYIRGEGSRSGPVVVSVFECRPLCGDRVRSVDLTFPVLKPIVFLSSATVIKVFPIGHSLFVARP